MGDRKAPSTPPSGHARPSPPTGMSGTVAYWSIHGKPLVLEIAADIFARQRAATAAAPPDRDSLVRECLDDAEALVMEFLRQRDAGGPSHGQ